MYKQGRLLAALWIGLLLTGCRTYVDMQDPLEIRTPASDRQGTVLRVQSELFSHYRTVLDNVLTTAGLENVGQVERERVVDRAIKAGYGSRFRSLRAPGYYTIKKQDMLGFLRLSTYYLLYPDHGVQLAQSREPINDAFEKRGLAEWRQWKPVTVFRTEQPAWAARETPTSEAGRVHTIVRRDYSPALVQTFEKALSTARAELVTWAKKQHLSEKMDVPTQRRIVSAVDSILNRPGTVVIEDIWYDFAQRRFSVRVGFEPAELARRVNEIKRRYDFR